ncbi:hypothetical protein Ddye_028910 [Dipteronia dyeriana]|uniref:CCHC-type domain-containing protein n=1 Tax=Dipteronia dyeriana TaxID=168575 RepID=A0AAD9TEM3_9ROSI|nr:hypothetical protein Ddye_028910 [Dipteronia dyeriana]
MSSPNSWTGFGANNEQLRIEHDDILIFDSPSGPMMKLSLKLNDQLHKPWANALILKIMGCSHTLSFMITKLTQKWILLGKWQLTDIGKGYFMARFHMKEDSEYVLTNGPWVISNQCLTVQRWKPNFVSGEDVIQSMPIWAHARGIFARICVEIDITKPLLGSQNIEDRAIRVEYESLGLVCFKCGRYGHSKDSCKEGIELSIPKDVVTNYDALNYEGNEESPYGPLLIVSYGKHGNRNYNGRNGKKGNGNVRSAAKVGHTGKTYTTKYQLDGKTYKNNGVRTDDGECSEVRSGNKSQGDRYGKWGKKNNKKISSGGKVAIFQEGTGHSSCNNFGKGQLQLHEVKVQDSVVEEHDSASMLRHFHSEIAVVEGLDGKCFIELLQTCENCITLRYWPLLNLDFQIPNNGFKPIRFEAMWLKHNKFDEMKQNNWSTQYCNFDDKLHAFTDVLKRWNKEEFAIPIYAMQYIKLPSDVCSKLDKMHRDFLWGNTTNTNMIHLVNWDTICLPKCHGGLGIKKTKLMNQALLAKASWRLFQNEKSLWTKMLIDKYGKENLLANFVTNKSNICSSIWWGFSFGAKLLVKGVKWRVVNGNQVAFWLDDWVPGIEFGVFMQRELKVGLTKSFGGAHIGHYNRCKVHCEDLEHVFRGCDDSLKIWDDLCNDITKSGLYRADWNAWMLKNLKCNSLVLGNVPGYLLQNIRNFVVDCVNVNTDSEKQTVRKTCLISWSTLIYDGIKLNVDGSLYPNLGTISAVGVIKNHMKEWLGGFALNKSMGSIIEAELWGIYEGLKIIWKAGFRNVTIELDSQTVVFLLSNNSPMNHLLFSLIQECRSLMNNDWRCIIHHVYRESNRVADCLAIMGHSLDLGLTFFNTPPFEISGVLDDNVKGLAFARLVPSC